MHARMHWLLPFFGAQALLPATSTPEEASNTLVMLSELPAFKRHPKGLQKAFLDYQQSLKGL
eukprot:804815-Pelagomonas_calceolata.AAC.6